MISVIIPAYNEEAIIKTTIQRLWEYDQLDLIKEIIIADGGSSDSTLEQIKTERVKVALCPKKGRAAQMNYGASFASSEIFYFLHADTLPPRGFSEDIVRKVQQGYDAGCFMLSFDHRHWFLKANCWFTRFNVDAFRFGDQSLFVTNDAFKKVGGFCEKHILLEDQQIIKRLIKISRFTIIKKPVLTSARKYLENGIYNMQFIFLLIYCMYRLGYSQQKLLAAYRKLIVQDKI